MKKRTNPGHANAIRDFLRRRCRPVAATVVRRRVAGRVRARVREERHLGAMGGGVPDAGWLMKEALDVAFTGLFVTEFEGRQYA